GSAAFDDDAARLVAETVDGDGDRMRRQKGNELVRPLDHGDAVAVHQLLDAEVEHLRQALGAVRVEMMDGHAPSVLVDEHDRRARHRRLDAQPAGEPLEETRLAGAELTDARHHRARIETRAQSFARSPRLLGTVRDHGFGGFHERLVARDPIIAAEIDSTMSPARTDSSPRSVPARSPAMPWRT